MKHPQRHTIEGAMTPAEIEAERRGAEFEMPSEVVSIPTKGISPGHQVDEGTVEDHQVPAEGPDAKHPSFEYWPDENSLAQSVVPPKRSE